MRFARALAAFMLCAVAASGAAAQTYPNRPVTLVVAFAPGGADDATARILQDPMQKALGQPIVVENVSGASGSIGTGRPMAWAHHSAGCACSSGSYEDKPCRQARWNGFDSSTTRSAFGYQPWAACVSSCR